MSDSFHPSLDELECFILDQLIGEEAVHVQEHLQVCAGCCYTVRQLRRQIAIVGLRPASEEIVQSNAYAA